MDETWNGSQESSMRSSVQNALEHYSQKISYTNKQIDSYSQKLSAQQRRLNNLYEELAIAKSQEA